MENKENIIEINGIEIKPGMVICTEDNDILIVFPLINSLGVINYKQCSWQNIEYFINMYKNKIKVILDKSKGCSLDNGDVLWEKPKRVTLTKREIADKFGIDINLLDIKD